MNTKEMKEKYEGLSLKQAAKKLQSLRIKHDKQKTAAAETWKEVDYLRLTLIPKLMDEIGTDNIRLEGIGRLSIRVEASCSTLDKEGLFNWLSENGHDELMSSTVNSSTLKAFVLNQIRDGEEIPNSDIIKFSTYEMATITKN